MANPRVFISSTCYDLVNERDSLIAFCQSFGFEVVLSDRGDIFFHPDLHTHTSCINEVSTCHLFILIIGGRFGGQYVIDKTKSITNAEYKAAREGGVPIFTFVKHDVLSDHHVWQKNKDQEFVKQINYPSIEKSDNSSEIFSFIDDVRHASTNNALFSFNLIKDIHNILRKQWASMFFDFLQNSKMTRQIAATHDALTTLTAASAKIEELVKSLYQNLAKDSADKAITNIDIEGKAKELFFSIAIKIGDKQYLFFENIEKLINSPPKNWYDFLMESGLFEITDKVGKQDEIDSKDQILIYKGGDWPTVAKISGSMTKSEHSEFNFLTEGYEAYLTLQPETRRKIINEFIWDPF